MCGTLARVAGHRRGVASTATEALCRHVGRTEGREITTPNVDTIYAAALEALHEITCEGTPTKADHAPGASRAGDWQTWMKAAHALMIENPPAATDRRVLTRMAPLGLGSTNFNLENGWFPHRELVAGSGERSLRSDLAYVLAA